MTDHLVEMRYSDDGGHNWSTWQFESLGDVGEFGKRVEFTRLGSTRARVFQIAVSGPVKANLMCAEAKLSQGSS
jgi:hypothetical protein